MTIKKRKEMTMKCVTLCWKYTIQGSPVLGQCPVTELQLRHSSFNNVTANPLRTLTFVLRGDGVEVLLMLVIVFSVCSCYLLGVVLYLLCYHNSMFESLFSS